MMNARNSKYRSGLSLVELIVVLMILAATAAMVVPLIDNPRISSPTGEEKTPEQIATEATMQKIRDVIMGTNDQQGVWADVGQRPENFPRAVSDLLLSVKPAYMNVAGQFDPITKIGWRGPYFIQATGTGLGGNPTLVDAWGTWIAIEIEYDASGQILFAQLVSAGEDGDFASPEDNISVFLVPP